MKNRQKTLFTEPSHHIDTRGLYSLLYYLMHICNRDSTATATAHSIRLLSSRTKKKRSSFNEKWE